MLLYLNANIQHQWRKKWAPGCTTPIPQYAKAKLNKMWELVGAFCHKEYIIEYIKATVGNVGEVSKSKHTALPLYAHQSSKAPKMSPLSSHFNTWAAVTNHLSCWNGNETHSYSDGIASGEMWGSVSCTNTRDDLPSRSKRHKPTWTTDGSATVLNHWWGFGNLKC